MTRFHLRRRALGGSPRTTLISIILACLVLIQERRDAGDMNWHNWILPVAIAVFGRLACDPQGRTPSRRGRGV